MTQKLIRSFTLTPAHITLMSKWYIEEGSCEACPPEVNQKRPWGNSDYLNDMAKILELPVDPDEGIYENEELCNKLEDTLAELVDALQIVLSCQTFEPGVYEFWGKYDWHDNGPVGWRRAENQNVQMDV